MNKDPPEKKRKKKCKKLQQMQINADCFTTKFISEEANACSNPIDFFFLLSSLFSEEFFTLIVTKTNLYALQNNQTLGITNYKMLAFIGGLLLSAHSLHSYKRIYWSSEDSVPKILRYSMQRDRFESILHSIHLVDITKYAKGDRAFKLRPILQHMKEKFLEHGGLSNPIIFGFKVWVLCSKHGYMHSFDLHLGKYLTSTKPSENIR